MSEIELKNCPFCGSSDIDPEGVCSFKKEYRNSENTWDNHTPEMLEHHPACNDCGATADLDKWNNRPLETALQTKIYELELKLELRQASYDMDNRLGKENEELQTKLDKAVSALELLLEDTQHKNHNCLDPLCPVLNAQQTLLEIKGGA